MLISKAAALQCPSFITHWGSGNGEGAEESQTGRCQPYYFSASQNETPAVV